MKVNVEKRLPYADTFWFTLFHEIGHILNGDLGISFKGQKEDEADLYAQRTLIPQEKYDSFVHENSYYDEDAIRRFADSIDRDSGIVLGRLMNDGRISHSDADLSKKLRHTYNVVIR